MIKKTLSRLHVLKREYENDNCMIVKIWMRLCIFSRRRGHLLKDIICGVCVAILTKLILNRYFTQMHPNVNSQYSIGEGKNRIYK